ncbi:hypothetical protein [Phenylobacterium sp.]|uniref:hypothetical protein n=1 Tax=Phenylobacterium sp. TaxID=1871053 RepID=UPI0025F9C1E8|nr:hypothetical protein [Phenylobacterium sp.]
MGIGLKDRLRAGLGSMEEWSRDRQADLAHGVAELEARSHQFYRQAIRDGQDTLAQTTSELREFAKQQSISQTRAARPSQLPAAHSGTSQSPHLQMKDSRPTGDLLESSRRAIGDIQRKAQTALQRAGDSGPVRILAGDAAYTAGDAAGLVTGTVHMGHELLDGAVLAGRVFDPTDAFRHPVGEAGWDRLFGGIGAMASSAKEAVTDPGAAIQRLSEAGGRLRRETDPSATPTAPTLSGEVSRNFGLGRREGEVTMEVLPYLAGAGELKATAELGAMSKFSRIAKYTKQGFSPVEAEYLAQPYKGMGHHSLLPRRKGLPDWLGGGPVPQWISDSAFNVLKPPGISRGDMYELHYKVDPHFRRAGLSEGGNWVGSRLGLKEYGPLQQRWHGTPNATRRAIAGGGIAGAIPFGDEE